MARCLQSRSPRNPALSPVCASGAAARGQMGGRILLQRRRVRRPSCPGPSENRACEPMELSDVRERDDAAAGDSHGVREFLFAHADARLAQLGEARMASPRIAPMASVAQAAISTGFCPKKAAHCPHQLHVSGAHAAQETEGQQDSDAGRNASNGREQAGSLLPPWSGTTVRRWRPTGEQVRDAVRLHVFQHGNPDNEQE